jgi:hypothetical protein
VKYELETYNSYLTDTTLARVASERFFIPKYVGAVAGSVFWLDRNNRVKMNGRK